MMRSVFIRVLAFAFALAQAKLLKTSGSPALDRASLRASSEWRLEPGKVDGKSTCMWMVFFFTWQ